MFDAQEGLLENDKQHALEQSRQQLLKELTMKQQERLITDTFSLVALVIRDRIGRFQQPADKLWDELLRKKDLQVFIFSLIGVLCSILMGWMLWTGDTNSVLRSVLYTSKFDELSATRFVGIIMLQVGISLSSVTTCMLLYQKYKLTVEEKRRLWSGMDMKQLTIAQLSTELTPEQKMMTLRQFKQAYTFWQSNLRFKLGGELIIHLFHPVLLLNENSTHFIFVFLEIFIFTRLYMISKLIYVFSSAYTCREEILSSNIELRRTGSPITVNSTLKMMYFSYPSLLTLCLMFLILAVTGFIVFLAERTTQPTIDKFGDLSNCYWFTFVTFLTIGYGDLVPKSVFARMVSIFIGASGITVITVVNGIITNLMVQSREQRFVSEYLQLVESTTKSRIAAVQVIKCAWRFYRARHGMQFDPWSQAGGHKSNQVHHSIRQFQKTRWAITQSLSTANDPGIDTKMNDARDDLDCMATVMERHERSITSTIDNTLTIAGDILDLIAASKKKF